MKSVKTVFVLLMTLALFATACGSDAGDSTAEEAESGTLAMVVEEDPNVNPTPGAGVEVTMGRANWATGYFQGELYKLLLEELGYTVGSPSSNELAPADAFLAMAEGDFDFWANSWYPGHFSWHDEDRADGTPVGAHISPVGNEMEAGGLQGLLITKSVAEEHGIQTLDQIFADPELSSLFDGGDGLVDIYGCPEGWSCGEIIEEMGCQFDWEFNQVRADYDAMVEEATAKANSGDAMLIYTWTPSAYITKLVPGGNVMWISAEGELDGSACGGQSLPQPNATAAIDADSCLLNSVGDCRLVFTAADIKVTANNDFLAANPAAEELLNQVVLPLQDVALANVQQDSTDGSDAAIRQIAERWLADNRDVADSWLNAARQAADS